MAKPIIDKKKCDNCKNLKSPACMDICPVGVFAKESKDVIAKNPNECIGCRACEAECPKNAIEVVD